MKCVELNREGNFDRWDQNWLAELEQIYSRDQDDNFLIYQNDSIKLSVIGLDSYERVPFRVIKNDFNLVCLTGGLAISRCSNGRISLLNFDKGEKITCTLKDSVMVNDFQNIGEDPMIIALLEYKRTFVVDYCPGNILDYNTRAIS